MAELRPCPFCGGGGELTYVGDYVLCEDCGASGAYSAEYEYKAAAVKAQRLWNTRPAEDELLDALAALLRRDEHNTCQHEETHRGGTIWEICGMCGAKWADDEGGMPKWKEPPEWTKARALLSKYRPEKNDG